MRATKARPDKNAIRRASASLKKEWHKDLIIVEIWVMILDKEKEVIIMSDMELIAVDR